MKMLYYQGVLLVVFPNSVNVCLYVQIAVSRYASGHYT